MMEFYFYLILNVNLGGFMKKLLLMMLGVLALGACTNEENGLYGDALTRGETIESQYQETVQYYVGLLETNGVNTENKFEKDLLYGTWECVDETAEIYEDGKKVNKKVYFIDVKETPVDDVEKYNSDFLVLSSKDGLHQLAISDSINIFNIEGGIINGYKNRWIYSHNHFLSINCSGTREEIRKNYIEMMPWLLNDDLFKKVTSYLPLGLWGEIIELSPERMLLKKVASIYTKEPTIYNSYPFTYIEQGMQKLSGDKSGIQAFSVLEYRKVKD